VYYLRVGKDCGTSTGGPKNHSMKSLGILSAERVERRCWGVRQRFFCFMSWKKKHKNIIDIQDSLLEIQSCDFEVEIMNDYQFRVFIPTNNTYDWYHTSGTVVVNSFDRTPVNTGWKAFDAKELVEKIIDTEEKHAFI
jgi:hypothetical protein